MVIIGIYIGFMVLGLLVLFLIVTAKAYYYTDVFDVIRLKTDKEKLKIDELKNMG